MDHRATLCPVCKAMLCANESGTQLKKDDTASQILLKKYLECLSVIEEQANRISELDQLKAEVARLNEKYDLQLLVKKCDRYRVALEKIATWSDGLDNGCYGRSQDMEFFAQSELKGDGECER